jgi:hypothetical protein
MHARCHLRAPLVVILVVDKHRVGALEGECQSPIFVYPRRAVPRKVASQQQDLDRQAASVNVPEPSMLALMVLGFAGIRVCRGRKYEPQP